MRAKVTWVGLPCSLVVAMAAISTRADTPTRPEPVELRDAMKTVFEARTLAPRRGPTQTPYIVLFLEFFDKAACDKACGGYQSPIHVFDRLDEFATVLIKVQDTADATNAAYNKTLDVEGLRWFDDIGIARLPPVVADRSEVRGDVKPETIAHGGVKGLTGKGVTIAVIDSGLDFRHPDFIHPDGTSRIAYYWDTLEPAKPGQGSPGPRTYFEGGPAIGTLYTREDLNRFLRAGESSGGPVDEGGHGTGCAGVAAGNGSAWKAALGRYPALRDQDGRGVAPDADLIAVRIGRTQGLAHGWMLNRIVGWLHETVGAKPLVISCSFGGHEGGHDASLIEERMLNRRMPSNTPGRAICIAAGNEATDRIHATARVAKDQPATIAWESRAKKSADGKFPEMIELFVDGVKPDEVKVEFRDGSQVKAFKPFRHGVSNARMQIIHLAGDGAMTLSTNADRPLRADVYYFADADDKGPTGRLANASNATQVGTPGTTVGAITVGSYDFNDMLFEPDGKWYSYKAAGGGPLKIGAISEYSNAGYLRSSPTGRLIVKPDVAAPGQWHVAAAAPSSVAKWTKREAGLDVTKRYCLFNGTSAATPYTAGVIALLMQKNPRLSADDFRRLISQHATGDATTGTTPNPIWGYGKLTLPAIEKMIDATKPGS